MTIKDIARLSGCGVGTVSRVLNNHPDVTEKTRQKVMAVVEKYHYQPNTNAKHLKQQFRSDISILVKGTQNMLFAEILEQIQVMLAERGQESVVHYLDEEADEVSCALQLCRERHPKGILFLGGDLELFRDHFSEITVPCVLITNTARELGYDNLSSLTTDDYAAAGQAVDFLIEQGHRNIGILGGNLSCSQIGYCRFQGCMASFQRHGIPFHEELQCEPCRYSMADGYQAACSLLDRSPDLTAIFAMGDVIAIGAIRALRDRGKRVPEDISVIGYDGIASGQFSVPRLATIQQDTHRMAERGTEILLRNLEHKPCPVHEIIPFRLIPGESVSTPAK
ncbi:MAG: LacI family DNA-binding transcriptional regulator [Candidatus Onthomonas sp.]